MVIMVDVCLPLVPFARVEAPSLALGIFKQSFELGVSSNSLSQSRLCLSDWDQELCIVDGKYYFNWRMVVLVLSVSR